MKFQDYLIESWKDYKVSNSPKVLLYDFYLLSYLSSLILDPGTRKDVGLTGVGYSGKFFGREGKELDEDIQNAQRKLLPFLGNKLSQALFLAVCAELRHVLDRNQQWSEFKHTKNKTFRNYIRNLEFMNNKELKDFQSKRNIENPRLQVQSQGYKTSYQAAKKSIKETGGNVIDFARMAADAFEDLNWSASYGGEKWAEIAKGYVDLRQALNNYNPEAPSPSSESAERLIAAIDHAFDLEHNTGTVLNKVKYFDVKGYNWIKTALDDKRDANMYDIAKKASSDMRKLGQEVLKVAGMQDKQMKKVPAEAGIPTKKIKLTGFTSKNNEGESIKDPSSLPIGSLITYDHSEYVAKVLNIKNAEKKVKVKFIAVKDKNDEKWLGKTHRYSFNYVKEKLHIVKKQDEAILLKDYFVDPSYKPEVTSTSSAIKIGDTVKVKNDTPKKKIKLAGVTSKKNEGKTIGNIPIGSIITDEYNMYVAKVLDVDNKKETVNVKYIAVKDKNDEKWLGKTHSYGFNQVKTYVIVNKQDEANFLKDYFVDPSYRPEVTITPSELKIGDTVKVKNNDMEGTVELINNEGDNEAPLVQIKVIKAIHPELVGIKTWYPADHLEKISPSKVVKLQGFGGKKPAKNEALLFSTEIESPYMLTIGSILINIHSSDLYIVQMVNGPENYIKIKLVASNDALEFPNYTEPELYNGGTIARDFRLIENKDKERAFASYEFIKLSSASREASKAANADEPAPRERDESLKVGNYYVISNETNIVQITALPKGYVEYKIVAATKKYKELEGVSSGMPKDMFIDSIDFAINPKSTEFNYYIRQFKNKR